MSVYGFYSYPSINHPINGEGRATYLGKLKYTGRWENGMKVGEGIIEDNFFKLRVKIKQGKIYKCLQVLNNFFQNKDEYQLFLLPPLKISKVGGTYKEEYSDSEPIHFFIKESVPAFDGKAYPFDEIRFFNSYPGNLFLASLKDRTTSRLFIIDYTSNRVAFTGKSLNLIPNGDFNILYDFIKIKANLKGHYFNGTCVVK